jgi:hypothetical protein
MGLKQGDPLNAALALGLIQFHKQSILLVKSVYVCLFLGVNLVL